MIKQRTTFTIGNYLSLIVFTEPNLSVDVVKSQISGVPSIDYMVVILFKYVSCIRLVKVDSYTRPATGAWYARSSLTNLANRLFQWP